MRHAAPPYRGERLAAQDVMQAAAGIPAAGPAGTLPGAAGARDDRRDVLHDRPHARPDRRREVPVHELLPIVTGLLFSVMGVVGVVGSLQAVYERIFRQEPRGWRGFPRWIAWTAILVALLVAEGALGGPVRRALGPVVRDLFELVAATLTLWWSMHFLLAGRTPWRTLARPAVATGVLWLGLGLFSSLYFSSVLVTDSRTYGEIGVVFTLLTWFFAIGAVLVLGPVCGVVWQARAELRSARRARRQR